MGRTNLDQSDIDEIIRLYQSKEMSSTHQLGNKFKVSHQRIYNILKDNNIETNKRGGQLKYGRDVVLKNYAERQRKDGMKIVAICKTTGKEFNDYTNQSGALTLHIQKIFPDVQIPSKYKRRTQYESTGIYWHESFFNIVDKDDEIKEQLSCPYCEWKTFDSTNKTGSLTKHLLRSHDINIDDFLTENPNYFKLSDNIKNKLHDKQMLMDDDNFVTCKVCDKKFKSLTETHLSKHGLTFGQYRDLYGWDIQTHSTLTTKKLSDNTKQLNIKLCDHYKTNNLKMPWHNQDVYDAKLIQNFAQYKDKITNDFLLLTGLNDYKIGEQKFQCRKCNTIFNTDNRYPRCYVCNPVSHSKEENEIFDFLTTELSLAVVRNNRKIIKGEIDLFIPSHNIGIEFNGLYWHAENSSKKDRKYHINKTMMSSTAGVTLYHIFWDEWVNKKTIIKNKLRHIFKLSETKLYARNCSIRDITSKESISFLNEYHVQGGINNKIRLGLFYHNILVGVMTFGSYRLVMNQTNAADEYELTRFATNHCVVGGAGKLLKHFIKTHQPKKIISYADIRWTPNKNENLYTSLGFDFKHQSEPNYWYTKDYNNREYRFNYRKSILVKTGGNPNLSEWNIMQLRGYDRIWDCGNYRYELLLDV